MDNAPMNRLANETSPYLLQHKNNPVDWFPWGEEAFRKAKQEDKPVFLSIGYSACHWCHVMERESFENDAIAEILNEHFVSIKVDREERPDIDSIYMQAVQMMTGHGGWPMSVFLTPEGGPFFGGTYFPPTDRHGMPGFARVLMHVLTAWRQRREEVEEAQTEVRRAIGRSNAAASSSPVDAAALDQAADAILQNYDPVEGGFGGAPKFPPAMTLDFLMQVAHREPATERAVRIRNAVTHTLLKMARGGIYDHVGGGFHRYSVDGQWLVPHFEKMLYDNALLARTYTRAWQWTKDPFFARVANETLGFIEREMLSPEGGFYSTLDADSEGEEGKFYVWTREEVFSILGAEEGHYFCALYDVTDEGNFEGKNILHLPRPLETVADELGLPVEQLKEVASRGRCKLYGVRAQRVWPARDTKILSGWNGWMLGAFAEAALALRRYPEVVRRNAQFLMQRVTDGRLIRHASIGGMLEDYSGVAWGLTLAYEALHERPFLDTAHQLVEEAVARFHDEAGGFFDTPIDHELLIARPKDVFDNATPAPSSMMIEVLLRHATLFGNERYALAAEETLRATSAIALRHPSGFGMLLGGAEWHLNGAKEIAITGAVDEALFRDFERMIGSEFIPHRVLVAGAGSEDLPLLQNRASAQSKVYVCEHYRCDAPADSPEALRPLLLPRRG